MTLLIISVITCALTVASVFTYIERPANAFKANIQPYPILTKIVNAGGEIKWHTNSCHVHNLPFESIRKIKNLDTGVVIEIIEHNTLSQTPVGKCMETDRSAVLPSSLQPGNYKLIFEIHTTVNRWNTNSTTFETDTFKIIKGQIGEGITK